MAPAKTVDALGLSNRLRPAILGLARALRREAHALGITGGQATVLGYIQKYPEQGVGELAHTLGMSAPALSRYLDRLQDAGYIERRRSTDDARKVRPAITPLGRDALRALRSRRTAWLAKRLKALPHEDLERLDESVEVLERILRQD